MRLNIGNDIVDFSSGDTQNKYQDTRFLKRVFSTEEIEAILQTKNKDKMLWALWSAKEAAFKACQKRNVNLIFSPKQFSLPKESLKTLATDPQWEALLGTLLYQEHHINLQWHSLDKHCVHCCAVLTADNKSFTNWHQIQKLTKKRVSNTGLQPSYSQQSTAVRTLLIGALEKQINPTELKVARPEVNINGRIRKGPPVLFQGQQERNDYDISLSHDGFWVACLYYQHAVGGNGTFPV